MQGMLKAQESTLLADQKLVLGQKQKNCRGFKKKKSDISELLLCFLCLSAVSLSSNTQPKLCSLQSV